MLLNDNRGSMGMFSRAGRNSADKYHILTRKDEILSGLNKKVKLPDLFTPEENIKNTEEAEDEIDIFKTEENEKGRDVKRKGEKLGSNAKSGKGNSLHHKVQKPKSEIAKYLEMKKKGKKKVDNPSCTKYNPKYECVWKKTIYPGPIWNQSIRKNFSVVPKEEVDAKFYRSHTDFKIEGKNFVDLARQTRRASFTGAKNLRGKLIKSSYSAEKDNDKMGETRGSFRTHQSLSFSKGKTSSEFYTSKGKQLNPISKRESMNNFQVITGSDENSENYFDYGSFGSRKKGFSVGKGDKSNFNRTNPTGTNRWVKIQAPDFKKIISREQLEKIYGDKRTIIPFSIPNFKTTRPRPIMMVKYDRAVYKKPKDNRPRTTEYQPNINYDPHRVLDKINNYKATVSPNFDMMTSRPNDGDPLPSYMKGIHSRQATELLTEKALKMNNFSDGKFSSSMSTFWPKKSFNKIINLNLLNSTKFKENIGLKTGEEMPQANDVNEYIQKSMKFYNKNYDDLMKESLLNKFDNVTYRTIKRENKLETGDLEKFLINFEKIDA